MAAHPSPRQRYREGRVLGRGAFGVVRIARDAVSGEDVVVKRVARPYVAAWSTSSTFHLFSPSPTHGHSLKHLRDAHATNDLLFESGHAATGPHAAPHEHDDYV